MQSIFKSDDSKGTKSLLVFNIILRLAMSGLFAYLGFKIHVDAITVAIIMWTLSAVAFATVFFRPKRCVDEQCEIKR